VGLVLTVERQPHLLEIIRALQPPARSPCRLHGRQEQGDEDANDGDHHQELDERKTV